MSPCRRPDRACCLLFLLVALSGCATAISPKNCSSATAPSAHAPANFGTVVAAKVFRGADLTDCDQFAFLATEGVTHILKLNASREEEAAGVHAEGRFEVMPIDLHAATVGRAGTCATVRAALDYLEDEKHWPVYVHCAAGKDRTGYIIGMFERETMGKPAGPVLQELGQFGHTGIRSFIFGQIDRELAKNTPVCSERQSSNGRQ